MQAGKLTLAIIIANALIYALIYLNFIPDMFLYFGLNIYCVAGGFYWQLLTSFFMHGSIMHVLMNMAVLFQFGSVLERSFGAVKFGILYIALGLITSLICLGYVYFAYIHLGQAINVVGASGVICALLGVILCFERQNFKNILIMFLVISFAPMLFMSNVAWYAHVAGFGVGFLFGCIQKRYRIL